LQALRIRHPHHDHDVMRDRMVWYVVATFKPETHDLPPIPDSIIPGQQQRPIRCASQEASRSASERVELEPRQSRLIVWTGQGRVESESRSRQATVKPTGTAARKRRPSRCPRSAGDEATAIAARLAAASPAAAAIVAGTEA
jgi:hypothetical protein